MDMSLLVFVSMLNDNSGNVSDVDNYHEIIISPVISNYCSLKAYIV